MSFDARFRRNRLTRRQFLKTTAFTAGVAGFGMPALLRGQNLNSKINIATIGAAGKGSSDTDHCAIENIVALCDADKNHCADQLKKYPAARFFQDYRKMFDEMSNSIDAVIVSTPDHFHAVAAAAAMQRGKHVYVQKPLTQTIAEARQLRDLARRQRIVSQMGNQGSSENGLRRAIEVVQAGVIGAVKEVHVWTNRPIWPQGLARPEGADPVPAGVDWDVWIGPAAMRPFKSGVYHPFNWRGWLDFGTGALGDMACHTVNMPFRALKLGFPSVIEAESSGMNGETYPLGAKIRFEFPVAQANAWSDPASGIKFWWYEGGKPTAENSHRHDGSMKPPREITADVAAFRGEVPPSGCMLVGTKGTLFSPDDYGTQFFIKLKDDERFLFYQRHPAAIEVPETLPRNPFSGDADKRQHLEWLAAIRESKPDMCFSRFDIAAELTEIMLLGCVALRVGKKLEWDGPSMRAKNAPEAEQYVRRQNRKGWEVSA
jgi:predicted dehydrogenase